MNYTQMNKSISFSDVLKSSLRLYDQNLVNIVGIMVFGYGLLFLEPLLRLRLAESQYKFLGLITLVGFPLSLWANASLILLFSRTHLNMPSTFKDCWMGVRGSFWSFVLYGMFWFLFTILGLLFFIIPGVYLGVALFFVPIATLLERDGNVSPLEVLPIVCTGNQCL